MQDLNYKAIGDLVVYRLNMHLMKQTLERYIFFDSEYLSLINLARVKQNISIEQFDLNEHLSKIERDKLEA